MLSCRGIVAILLACRCSAVVTLPSSAFIIDAAMPPWLDAISSAPVLRELRALAALDEASLPLPSPTVKFEADWQGLTNGAPRSWSSIELLNKGMLSTDGCAVAPKTCAALQSQDVAINLSPTVVSPNVGVRLLKLAPGASLRQHRGPGGRYVAHLGVQIPPSGASITVGGTTREWVEGGWLMFDDEVLHSATNAHGALSR